LGNENDLLFRIHDKGKDYTIMINIKSVEEFNELFDNYKKLNNSNEPKFLEFAYLRGYEIIELGNINVGYIAPKEYNNERDNK
jgi:hypothetical protein